MVRILALAFAAVVLAWNTADAADTAPWMADTALGRDAMADVQAQGVRSVASHLDALEAALARAGSAIAAADASRPTRFVLTDGFAQTIRGMADKSGGAPQSVAIANPYPQIGLILGSYYNETGKPEDAVRVMDIGIASDVVAGIPGDTMPILKGERANSLMTLKRYPEALAAYADTLALKSMPDVLRAHLLRGQGFALTETGRLDDAEKSYNDSLVLEPGNPTALNELKYLAQLRAGRAPDTSGGIKPLQPDTTDTPANTTH
jgi:tetratricopeptide (TPR) repeat protein